jgi:hypothetical protein
MFLSHFLAAFAASLFVAVSEAFQVIDSLFQGANALSGLASLGKD